jgi:hypothetical protein
MDSKQRIDKKLLDNIKENLPKLVELMEEMSSHWFYEDPIYRFYHQSFKVYSLQEETKKIVEALHLKVKLFVRNSRKLLIQAQAEENFNRSTTKIGQVIPGFLLKLFSTLNSFWRWQSNMVRS